MIELSAIERDLTVAYASHLERRRRRKRRRGRVALGCALVAGLFVTAAVASDIGPDLQLDPAKWFADSRGSVDGGRGEYVHARRSSDGSPSTFMVEHDAGLAPYAAFLLHERTKAAADGSSPVPVRAEPGALCTPQALTRAESIAFAALAGALGATQRTAEDAVAAAFLGDPCRGLAYASEQAWLVWSGKEPRTLLMPGAG
jgi:hypothetical protein